MALERTIPMNFTSPRFAELGHFRVPQEVRIAEMYVCSCGNVQYAPEKKEEPEEEGKPSARGIEN